MSQIKTNDNQSKPNLESIVGTHKCLSFLYIICVPFCFHWEEMQDQDQVEIQFSATTFVTIVSFFYYILRNDEVCSQVYYIVIHCPWLQRTLFTSISVSDFTSPIREFRSIFMKDTGPDHGWYQSKTFTNHTWRMALSFSDTVGELELDKHRYCSASNTIS